MVGYQVERKGKRIMDIKKALSLQVGDYVHCPPDRGDLGYAGKVVHVSRIVNKNIDNKEYIWVVVAGPHHDTTWPSNRLG